MSEFRHFRIGLDFDDVLIASADHTVELYNARYGTELTRDDWYDDPDIVDPWKVETFKDVVERVVQIQQQDDFLSVEPLKEAQRVLKRLKAIGHELVVITGRPEQLRSSTLALLDKYYGDVFKTSDLYFTNHFAHNGTRVHKGDIAKELNLTHFVDDVIQHANNVSSAGVRTILFSNDYKWNQGEVDEGVVRLNGWREIGEFFDAEQNAE